MRDDRPWNQKQQLNKYQNERLKTCHVIYTCYGKVTTKYITQDYMYSSTDLTNTMLHWFFVEQDMLYVLVEFNIMMKKAMIRIRTMNRTAGAGVIRLIWTILSTCGMCPSWEPTKNNLKQRKNNTIRIVPTGISSITLKCPIWKMQRYEFPMLITYFTQRQ